MASDDLDRPTKGTCRVTQAPELPYREPLMVPSLCTVVA